MHQNPTHSSRDADRLSVSVVTNAQDMRTLEPDWRKLEAEAPGAILFQGWDWCATALAAEPTHAPFILCVHQGERLVGLLPLKITTKWRMKVLTGLAEPFQEFSDLLVAPGYPADELVTLMMQEVSADVADLVHLGQVRADSHLFGGISGHLVPVGKATGAPSVSLSDYPDVAAYMATVRSKTRKNIRNARNRMEKGGRVADLVTTHGAPFDAVVARCFEGRQAWLEAKGITSRAFSDTHFGTFLESFKSGGSSPVETLAITLHCGDDAVADIWGFVHRERFYTYMNTYDEAFAAFSPGKMLLGSAVEACFAQELAVMETMVPEMPYKMTWATHTVPVRDQAVGLTPRGKFYVNHWLGGGRDRTKALFQHLPVSLRRWIIHLI